MSETGLGSTEEVVESNDFFEVSVVFPEGIGFCFFLHDSRRSTAIVNGIFVAASGRRKVYVSKNNGKNWELFYSLDHLSDNQEIVRLYVATTCIVLQTKNPSEIIVLSCDGVILHRQVVSQYTWHGSQGISCGEDGTIMFAEYQTGDEQETPELSVWRNTSPHKKSSWHKVLTKKVGNYPRGDIRHFHTCVAVPGNPRQWYVSSGDKGDHNKVWVSEDNGETWLELSLIVNNAYDIPGVDKNRLVRYTSIQFNNQGAIWATDDSLGLRKSAVVKMSRVDSVANLHVVGFLGSNLARNTVKFKNGYLVLCEAKSEEGFFDIFLLSSGGESLRRFRLKNLRKSKSPVTNSFGSAKFSDGCAFFPNLGVVHDRKGGLMKFSLKRRGGLDG